MFRSSPQLATTLMLLFALDAAVGQPAVAATPNNLLRSRKDNVTDDPPSIYDCLQAASGADECHDTWKGQCVWCAEPIYGVCVTPGVADKIGMLPFFSCDDPDDNEKAAVMATTTD